MTFIFTALFSARFRLTIHDGVTSRHTLFSNTIANSCLSRSYAIQVENAVVLEE